MKELALATIIPFIAGFWIAWSWQGSRADVEILEIKENAARNLAAAHEERDKQAMLAEEKKAEVEHEFRTFKESEDHRNSAVSSGAKRVYVRANCPAMPSTSTDSSGAASRAAELDSAYRRTLSDLRIGVEEQRRLLNLCRAELVISR